VGLEYPTLDLVKVEDIVSDDLTDALKDVTAIIHVASPLAGSLQPEAMLNTALNGTMNILEHAKAAGIKKLVLTSSFVTVWSSLDHNQVFEGIAFTEKVFPEVTKEMILKKPEDNLRIYTGAKMLAEIEALAFASNNSDLKIATINPPFVYGPGASKFPRPGSAGGMGTNRLIYMLLCGRLPPSVLPPYFCDVRDVARAHVQALSILPTLNQPERFLISGGVLVWKDAAEYLAETMPHLKSRIPSLEGAASFPGPVSTIDTTHAKNLLGMAEYIDWKTCTRDAVISLLEAEASWARGV